MVDMRIIFELTVNNSKSNFLINLGTHFHKNCDLSKIAFSFTNQLAGHQDDQVDGYTYTDTT